MPLSDIVDVNITQGTTTVSQKAFNVGMFLGMHKNFTEVAKVYSSVTELGADGFLSTSPEYKAAAAYFGQEVSPDKLVIGRRPTTDVTTLLMQGGDNGATYIVDINGESVTYVVSGGAKTDVQVATALASAIDALPLFTASSGGTATITINPSVPSTAYTFSQVTSNMTTTFAPLVSGTAGWSPALDAVKTSGLDWYAFGTYSHLEADILKIAEWAATNVVLYGYSTSNTVDKTSTNTGVMSKLQSLTQERTFGIWNAESTNDASGTGKYAEMAWIGDRLAYNPGESTWMFKDLSGIAVDVLTTSESDYIRSYYGNTYETIGGVNITREGKLATGEFIDVQQGIDWMTSRMTERIYSKLVQLQKIPFTDIGIQVIVGEVRGTLEQAGELGILDLASGYTITYPKVLDIPADARARREIPADKPIKFTARLAGAIHKVVISGNVTV